jgi:hypothetical protein
MKWLFTFLSDGIGKGPNLTVPGMWPLCYSWIGYLQANDPPRALRSKKRGSRFYLKVITAPFKYCQIFISLPSRNNCRMLLISACLPISSWEDVCQERSLFSGALHSWLADDNDVPVYAALKLILTVIIPHMTLSRLTVLITMPRKTIIF